MHGRLTKIDWLVAAVACAWMVVEDLAWSSDTTLGVRLATGLVAVAPILLARRHPVPVGLWIGSWTALRYAIDAQPWENAMPFATTMALAYWSAREAPDRRAAARRGVLSVGPFMASQYLFEPDLWETSNVGITTAFLLCCWGIGNGVRERWVETRALRRDRAAIERSRAAELRSATAEERARIARELHGIVTAATLRTRAAADAAGAALGRADAPAAERHLLEAQQTTHATVDDLRRLLKVLRSAPAESPAVAAEPAPARRDAAVRWAVLLVPALVFTLVGVLDQQPGDAGAWTAGRPDRAVPVALAIAVVPALALVLRRRWPVAAALGAVGLFAAEVALGLTAVTTMTSWSLTGYAVWVIARSTGGRPAAAAIAVAFVPLEVQMAADPVVTVSDVIFMTLWPALAAGAGVGVRRRELAAQRARDDHAEALEARTRGLEDALAAERRAIARDMHDVVGHALTLLAIHAAAARRYVVRDPDVAGAHVDVVRSAAADAEVELERLLATIEGPLGGLGAHPGVGDLHALAHGAGARFEAGFGDVPESVGLAAYRIVQEALTNARKHAPGADVAVTAYEVRGMLELTIASGPARRPREGVTSGGHGLVGMAERVRLFSGEFSAGPDGDGWRVRAALPTGHVPQAPVFALAERVA